MAYFLAIDNVRPGQSDNLALWHTSLVAEKIRSEMSHQKTNRFRRISSEA